MGGITTHLGKPTGKALSHLIGSVLDIPAAWLDQQVQDIKDATSARSHATQMLATQTAKTVITDPEIMERATENIVATAYRRQISKEAVVLKTIKNLQADPSPEKSDGPSENWLANFVCYAEGASSERLQTLFAKLLAGEIRKPGDISPMTLHFVSMLDQKTASLIQRVFPYTAFTSLDLSAAGHGITVAIPPLMWCKN